MYLIGSRNLLVSHASQMQIWKFSIWYLLLKSKKVSKSYLRRISELGIHFEKSIWEESGTRRFWLLCRADQSLRRRLLTCVTFQSASIYLVHYICMYLQSTLRELFQPKTFTKKHIVCLSTYLGESNIPFILINTSDLLRPTSSQISGFKLWHIFDWICSIFWDRSEHILPMNSGNSFKNMSYSKA